jgi:hypothetical protein
MKLYAISDLHIGHPTNYKALEQMPTYPEDWLILAGDVGETTEHLSHALAILTRCFAQVIWVPGNHDLWTLPNVEPQLRGEAKYHRLIEICRNYDVLTPEDPYIEWPGQEFDAILAPMFVLYDYSFRPEHTSVHQAIAWAEKSGVVCTDEVLLHPDPYPSLSAWCAARCHYSEKRLASISNGKPLIVINHFPLRQDLVNLPWIPQFSLWCGTRRTEEWHKRFPIKLVVYGHLHIRSSSMRDGVHFEEVSLGYPRHWDRKRGIADYLREISLETT